MGMMQEFKDFVNRGNVMDLAVGVIIGGAFGSIVNSLVGDVMMPVIGKVTGGLDVSGMAIALGEGDKPAMLKYGAFMQSVINFVIIAFCVFMLVKAVNSMKKPPAPAPPAGPTPSESLLGEIRDLLKKR
jgi:large conductance mechanosensitive channel